MKPLISLLLTLIVASQVISQETDQRQDDRYRRFFSLQGVEWNDAQQPKVQTLRDKYVPKLVEIQQQRSRVETPEQRRARRDAVQKARQEGKAGQELRAIGDDAVKFTPQQKTSLATLQEQQQGLVGEIQQELRALLTAEQRAASGRRNQSGRGRSANAPTHANLHYGPHERNVMDVWLVESETPAPVLVSIHGGGFRGGNKSVSGGLLNECLESGISVVAITYRLSDVAIAPAQFHDSARAIQFIRHNAKKWNIDPKRIASTGGSAGAGISLWLGFHDELADPDNEDPVLRESSRLSCMAVYNGQTSYDPRFIRDLFPENDTYKHAALAQLYDADLDNLDDLPEEKYRLFEEVSALPHLTKDDVPALLIYASKMDTPITSHGIGIHHPRFGRVLKERMDSLGIECRVETGVGRGDADFTTLTMDFVKRHLAAKSD